VRVRTERGDDSVTDVDLLPLYVDLTTPLHERQPTIQLPDGFGLPPEGSLPPSPTRRPRPSCGDAVQRIVDIPAVDVARGLATMTIDGVALDLGLARAEGDELHLPVQLRTGRLGRRRHAELIVQPWSTTRAQVWLRCLRSHASQRWFDAAHDAVDAMRRDLTPE
jgi:hypothetical protein